MAITIFLFFVAFTLGLSWWLGKRAKTASGYFAAHGQVGWFVNGVAFAGDYLSAASFLGICGLIAFYGYDGFLYSIGFLAGWVVALFVIAEPIKKLGKFTFADALSSKFGGSRLITFAAAVSTLVVSVFYLIPQMVGAGSLIKPLLGLEHHWGVMIVGGVVILIVTTAGMVSTTWVQFIKGSMLVVFCAALVIAILAHGIEVNAKPLADDPARARFTTPKAEKPNAGLVVGLKDGKTTTGAVGPAGFINEFSGATIQQISKDRAPSADPALESWISREVKGADLLLPGGSPTFKGIRSTELTDRLDFVSLMLALFGGTAALPHILIRYYTVKDAASARKSTVVGIISIGFFYMLTLYIGMGAMVSGNLDPVDNNQAAPRLAAYFGAIPFAIITAIAFTTVLGTVSGLILAASGAVAHDLIEVVGGKKLNDHAKVGAAKWAALVVGVVAVALGILFKQFNASFLVGWAFNIAASANLPAIVMLLFWSGTTREGIVASILVGLFSALTWLMLSGPAFQYIYKDMLLFNVTADNAVVPFSQPGLVTIPLAFATLVAVSLITRKAPRVA